MKNLILTVLATISIATLAHADTLPNADRFAFVAVTNLPTVITAGATSNVNCVVLTYGNPVDIFPSYAATNASTSNLVMTISYPSDSTLTNWTTTPNTLLTNALTGTTNVLGRFTISGAIAAFRVDSIHNYDSNTVSVVGVSTAQRKY